MRTTKLTWALAGAINSNLDREESLLTFTLSSKLLQEVRDTG